MNAYTLSTKGQITLRKDLQQHIGVRPGEKIKIEKMPDGSLKIAAERATGKISDAFGMFKRGGQKPVSIEDMNEAIAAGWAGEP